jgi:2-polyprenyl-6-methoxyphenol hydroxylase-like FAD-dependent oxidoreductase
VPGCKLNRYRYLDILDDDTDCRYVNNSMPSTSPVEISTRCCIAGGGPAGMMLGFLLARAGVEVIVLEKHADFLRDFRGDTIHPSTLEIMHELGLLEDFLKRPHQEMKQIAGQIGAETIVLADFSHLPTKCKFLAFMPQWDFLNFLVEHAERYPAFRLMTNTEVIGLIEAGSQVCGVKAKAPDGPLEILADLVVGADGRSSVVRAASGLEVEHLGAPIDVLWFRLPRKPDDQSQALGRFASGKIMVMINRDSYWQCGYIIRKGALDAVKQRGLEKFRQDILSLAPFLGERINEIRDWSEIKLLTVLVDRLRQWYRPGLLCIGDAAHAMSPVGGIGINLAIQDAVATANILWQPLSEGFISPSHLQKVQWRRELPTRLTQRGQVFVQDNVLGRVLGSTQPIIAPWFLRIFKRFPVLRRIPARLIGLGVRPEHVKSPDVSRDASGQ